MHNILLHDRVRMDAYRRAICAIVQPGNIVADLGTGTGALAFLALKAGAKHVHAVEVDAATLTLAKGEAARRGLADRIMFYRGLSQRVRPQQRVDVVVTETLGNLGLNENIATVLADARRRWLKRGGRMIPQMMALTIAPLGRQPALGRYWQGGLVSATVASRAFLADPVTLPCTSFTAPALTPRPTGIVWCQVPYDAALARHGSYQAVCMFRIRRSSTLYGFAGWFTVWLTDTISFTTAPDAPPTHWQQAILPLRAPIPVRAGQHVYFWLEIVPDRSTMHSIVSYDIDIRDAR